MENRVTRFIYDHSSVLLQHAYTSVFGLRKRLQRFGGKCRQYEESFRASAGWSREELEVYQDEKVRQVVQHAYQDVPFHRKRMDALHLRPEDIRGVTDLPKLPLMEKAELRAAGQEVLSTAVRRHDMVSSVTSGSTGFPLHLCCTRDALQREYGFHWARRRPGVSRGQSSATFSGLQLVRADRLKPPFWRFDLANNAVCYSIFHISPTTIPFYLERMRSSRHTYLQGYPSVIAMLGKYILDNGIDWPCPPKAMFVSAEELLPDHRDWIEKGFKTRVYNCYGQDEKCASITEYDCGHLHYDMDYSVIEFLPSHKAEDGRQVYEIVATAFDNPALPYIRYRMGDLALLPEAPVACERMHSPVVEAIYGRTGQGLISKDGRRISNIAAILQRCTRVEMVQCVQHEPGEVEIRVVRGPGYTQEDEQRLLSRFAQKMGKTDFRIAYVDNIERTASGKFMSIVSKVPPEQRNADGHSG